jgi:hypothetical protein
MRTTATSSGIGLLHFLHEIADVTTAFEMRDAFEMLKA